MTATPPVNARFPLIVVKRVYFDQFAAGTKTVDIVVAVGGAGFPAELLAYKLPD